MLAGISFPFRLEGRGIPASARGRAAIRSCLIALLRTPRRSRVMRPELGVDLQSILFEDAGPITAEILKEQIAESISTYLPQVKIIYIEVKTEDKKFTVNIRYSTQGILDETGEVELK